jgi:hypothetical protein
LLNTESRIQNPEGKCSISSSLRAIEALQKGNIQMSQERIHKAVFSLIRANEALWVMESGKRYSAGSL